MRKVFIFLFLIASAFAPAAAIAQRKLPPKITAIAPPKKATSSPTKIGITVERYVSSYEVNSDGTSVQTIEMLQRFETDEAAKSFNKFERFFNSDLEAVEVKEAYTIAANGKRTTVPASNIEIKPTLQTESAPAFSSLKIATIKFPEAAKGDAAFYKIRILQNKPVFENHFDTVELFHAIFDWKSIEINLSAPASYPLFVEAVDLEGGKLADENGRARWQWRKQSFPALELEPIMFGIIDASPRLAITSFKDYQTLGAAYWAEAAKKSAPTPEIQKLADEITRGISEPKEQAAAIYDWTNRNIRYLSIVLGRGGWIPHDAAQILANRYGDCKDYTTLLQALLAAKGIESYPFIVRADGAEWFPKVAAPEYFNHAILYIPNLEIFADATAPNTRIGLLPQILAGKKGFLAGARNGVVQIPAGKPDDNRLTSEIEVNFAPNGDIVGRTRNSYSGRIEIVYRPMFADSRLEQNADTFFRMLLAYYGMTGTGKMLKVSDSHRVGEPFSVEIEITLPDYTTFMKTGSVSLPVALNLNNLLELEKVTTTENRKTSLMLGASVIRENFKINFPAGVTVTSVPATVSIDNVAGTYKLDYKLAENTVFVSREVVFKKDYLTPQEYPKLRELIKSLVESYNGQISYQADAAFAKQKSAAMRKQPAKKPISIENVFEEKLASDEYKPLTPRQVNVMEAKLKLAPDDVETRRRLIFHYSSQNTTAKRQSRIRHSLWFLQNRPEIFDAAIYGAFSDFDSPADEEYKVLKEEWLRQVEARKSDAAVRLNAAGFVRDVEWQAAEKLLLEGIRLDPNNYKLALELAETYGGQAGDKAGAERTNFLSKAFEQGERALQLLTKERSVERDAARLGLLLKMAQAAFELGKLDKAKIYATELVLEFSDDSGEAAHRGNIVLGRIALKENNLAKAKEHLLIAARSAIRAPISYFVPDMELARELFEKGEKQIVVDYLKLCEGLESFNKEERSKVLRRWQTEIAEGKTPSFNEDEL